MCERLLSLRVDFRDDAAAAEITPEMARAYLTARSWEPANAGMYTLWRHGDAVTRCLHETHWIDYGRRMVELVNDVAVAEGRSPLAVWWEMRDG